MKACLITKARHPLNSSSASSLQKISPGLFLKSSFPEMLPAHQRPLRSRACYLSLRVTYSSV